MRIVSPTHYNGGDRRGAVAPGGAEVSGEIMSEVLRAFRRESDGTWVCVEATTFDGPNGRIQVAPGTRVAKGELFMGTDLGKWLDEQLERYGKRPS
jgi:hypothetical protein